MVRSHEWSNSGSVNRPQSPTPLLVSLQGHGPPTMVECMIMINQCHILPRQQPHFHRAYGLGRAVTTWREKGATYGTSSNGRAPRTVQREESRKSYGCSRQHETDVQGGWVLSRERASYHLISKPPHGLAEDPPDAQHRTSMQGKHAWPNSHTGCLPSLDAIRSDAILLWLAHGLLAIHQPLASS